MEDEDGWMTTDSIDLSLSKTLGAGDGLEGMRQSRSQTRLSDGLN